MFATGWVDGRSTSACSRQYSPSGVLRVTKGFNNELKDVIFAPMKAPSPAEANRM